jgi:cephalosporin hydroxylase
MTPEEEFGSDKVNRINAYHNDVEFKKASADWIQLCFDRKYVYNFTWWGRPIIQHPVDMIAMQEVIFDVKPDLIIETGIAHGGSLIYWASLLELLGEGRVVGVDVDIRIHNRRAIEAHPMFKRITLIEGSSVDPTVVSSIAEIAAQSRRVLVCLDSNHTRGHVLQELHAYAPLVTRGSYCVVFDTIVEFLPDTLMTNRPWKQGDNPHTAITDFLAEQPVSDARGQEVKFEIDRHYKNKLMLSFAPDGFLHRL